MGKQSRLWQLFYLEVIFVKGRDPPQLLQTLSEIDILQGTRRGALPKSQVLQVLLFYYQRGVVAAVTRISLFYIQTKKSLFHNQNISTF